MRKQELKELREKNLDQLIKELQEDKARLVQLRFDVKANQLKNFKEIIKIRRRIARIKTIINEKKSPKIRLAKEAIS